MSFKLFVTGEELKSLVSDRMAEAEKKLEDKFRTRISAAQSRVQEDEGWRRLTYKTRLRDLTPIKQDKQIKIADHLYERNSTARRIVHITTDFVLGEGVTYVAVDKNVQKILDQFWADNEWDLKQDIRINELGLYGEQTYKTFVNKANGAVRHAAIDPETISKVIPDKDNCEKLEKMELKSDKTTSEKDRQLDIIQLNEKTGLMEGDVFFFPVNKTTFATRGKSDLLSIADWLDLYDRTLYTQTERAAFLLAFIWDVLIEGADEEVLTKRLKEIQLRPPKPGTFQVHNDKEKWTAIAPDLRGRDFAEHIRQLKIHISSGSGFPEHWLFGHGENANKATAERMSEPVFRQLKRRQNFVRFMFDTMFLFQIDRAIAVGALSPKVDKTVAVQLPEPSKEEADQIATTMGTLAPALMIATEKGWITDDTAAKLTAMILSQLGMEIKPEDERKKAAESMAGDVYAAMEKVKEAANAKEKSSK